jgi:hypothetical protein
VTQDCHRANIDDDVAMFFALDLRVDDRTSAVFEIFILSLSRSASRDLL